MDTSHIMALPEMLINYHKDRPDDILPQSKLRKNRNSSLRKDVCGGYPNVRVQCWAHTRKGKRCMNTVTPREGEPIPIPYCNIHLRNGDGCLKVVKHPFAGKCLVARICNLVHVLQPNRYDLPKAYRIAFWGKRGRCPPCDKEDRSIAYFPPNKETGLNTFKSSDDKNLKGRNTSTRTIKNFNYNGVINPEHTGDVVQYAACPGPHERQNMKSTFQYFGKRNGTIGGLEFITLEYIPKNTQLCHWYGPRWWSSRGIKRRNVGTEKYPVPASKRMLLKRGGKSLAKNNFDNLKPGNICESK